MCFKIQFRNFKGRGSIQSGDTARNVFQNLVQKLQGKRLNLVGRYCKKCVSKFSSETSREGAQFIRSFRRLSYDRSIPSSQASFTHSTIQCFLFQFPVSSAVLKFIQQLLTTSSSSYRYCYPSFQLSFNNVFQKAVPMQDVTNPASLYFHCMQDIPILLDFI